MPVDPYFTTAWKKPRVNHAHDPAWESFKCLPPHEQQSRIDALFDKRRQGVKWTAEDASMVARYFVTRKCKKAIARHGLINRNYTVTHYRRVVGGYNTSPK
jgi:hypothetical protein